MTTSLFQIPRCENVFLSLLIFIGFLASTGPVIGQCTCMGGAAVSGGIPGLTLGAMGVLPEDDIQLAASYRYGFGDTYLRGSNLAERGPVLHYRMHYLDLSAAYGLTDNLTLDAGIGVFPQKTQQLTSYAIKGSGISHVTLGGRYLLLESENHGVEWTLGVYGKIPVDRSSMNLPQHINPSTGAFGGSFHTRVIFPVADNAFKLLCSQSVDINGVNTQQYQYGLASTTGIGALFHLSERSVIIAEIRGIHRMRDQMYDEFVYDTGSTVISIVPQFGMQFGSWLLAPYIEYPFFRHYEGYQLANDVVMGMNIIWDFAGQN